MKTTKQNVRQAFTLLELLVVVLIIAILAALAVPNFLEFQTRGKVSRVRSMHSYFASETGFVFGDGEEALLISELYNTEAYDQIVENEFQDVMQEPLSTFSIDVDTASYSIVRRHLENGQRPPRGAVRTEELVNYFDYDYPQPEGDDPFSVNVELASAPWKPEHQLVRIGLKGREVEWTERPACNLVFLVDVSGSMSDPNKLPLAKRSLNLLVNQLDKHDHVALAVYAGSSGLVLNSTPGDQKQKILKAVNRLKSGGSTNGAEGIQLAYRVAEENFIQNGVNRVILLTDGDFNVGVTSQSELIDLVQDKAKSKIELSVIGFGMGNYKDSTLEKLADKGDGNYAYIDTFKEAEKVFFRQVAGNLITIARDVKAQVEFNPAYVQAYRLLGYENRILATEDFNDDSKDAGEIGAGHTVTAFYELILQGADAPELQQRSVDPLKYQTPGTIISEEAEDELMTVKLRFKPLDSDNSRLIAESVPAVYKNIDQATPDFQFAASVVEFCLLMRQSRHQGLAQFSQVLELARKGLADDEDGYRSEFIQLVRSAQNSWVETI